MMELENAFKSAIRPTTDTAGSVKPLKVIGSVLPKTSASRIQTVSQSPINTTSMKRLVYVHQTALSMTRSLMVTRGMENISASTIVSLNPTEPCGGTSNPKIHSLVVLLKMPVRLADMQT